MNDDSTQSRTPKSSNKTTIPIWFWVVSVVGLLWYVMDTSMFAMRLFMTDAAIKEIPENQKHLFQNIPLWVNIVFAGEVFGGLFGCVALLLKKKLSLPLFIISILGVLAQTSNIWFLTDAISVMGAPAIVMPLIAIIIGTVLIFLAKFAITEGWLR